VQYLYSGSICQSFHLWQLCIGAKWLNLS